MKIAVVGAGISGLACAYKLAPAHAVTLYEAEPRLGGHTNTVDVTLDGNTHPVDTGFLVFNHRSYKSLPALFDELGVRTAQSEMTFAVSVAIKAAISATQGSRRLEWAGNNLNTVFAQRRNLFSPRFLSMVADILRFNRQGTAIALGNEQVGVESLGEFLDRTRYGVPFRQWYLLPMAAAIWSCPMRAMLAYPVATFLRFCHNHGLLQVENRPQWYTVPGGARQYVQKIAATLPDVRVGEPVQELRRTPAGVTLRSPRGSETFDHAVLACHSDQSLRLLADASVDERAVLAACRYQPNRALLHTDTRLLPQTQAVWSAWNYMSDGGDEPNVSVTYLLNKLQPLPFATPLLLSLNPTTEPRAETVIATFDYAHPIFDAPAVAAQQRLSQVQGRDRVWLAGAWTGYGFHEDGLKSGLAVAEGLMDGISAVP
jgi:predicted NAD/FAD-binding protein